MSAVNKSVAYHFTSGVFDAAHVQKIYEALRSVESTGPGTGVFRTILENIPNNKLPGLGGESINNILITDDYSRISQNEPPPYTGSAAVVNGDYGDTLPIALIA